MDMGVDTITRNSQALSLEKPSVVGNHWHIFEPSERDILTLIQRFGLTETTAKVVLNRGITLETVDSYLNPTLRQSLPDPFHLLDMDKAVTYILKAIQDKKKIAVFGDYDVDGATSSSLLHLFFRAIGIDITIYIPDRMTEGYGPNSNAFTKLKESGIDLVITVDCGAVSFEPIEHAKSIGLDVIVVDHHLGAETLPDAIAVVNPNRLDETTEYRYLAAVGVCYLLIIALNKKLRENGYYHGTIKEPNLLSFLDIVALGTVCDVMPIKGLNRVFVRQGLRIMAKGQNLGLRTLSDVASIDSFPSSYHLGFALGPRINAGGRVGQANLGSRLLTTTQQAEAFEIANLLSMYNDERKEIENNVLEEAIATIERQENIPVCIIAMGEGWHQGVIGIIASRLKDRYDRPSIVLSVEGNIAKASARSVKGIDMGAAVSEAKKQGLLIAGGGHEMAAGFSVETDKIELLSQFLNERFSKALEDYQSKKSLKIDAVMSIKGVSVGMIKELEKAAPFGVGNPSPKFVLYNCMIIRTDIVGEKHVRCIIGSHMTGQSGPTIKAMSFRSVDTEIGTVLLHSKGKLAHIAGQVRINSWQGNETAEFTIEDIII